MTAVLTRLHQIHADRSTHHMSHVERPHAAIPQNGDALAGMRGKNRVDGFDCAPLRVGSAKNWRCKAE